MVGVSASSINISVEAIRIGERIDSLSRSANGTPKNDEEQVYLNYTCILIWISHGGKEYREHYQVLCNRFLRR